MKEFLLSFIPIFVAMDAIGVLPMFIGFTGHLKPRERQKILTQSIITAFVIGIVFLFLGKWIFKVLGVFVADFKIAGGLVLLAISLRDILSHEKSHKIPSDTMGAVPIGTPLITGPAVLTTIIILLDSYGMFLTITSFVINLILTWITFSYAAVISDFLGKAGSKAFSKIASLLLAAIAVMMMRKGIVDTITYFLAQKPA
ncbi:MAG: MarC family protein [Candidatus Omnitrophica bacterium]|nr:MarC family protein [Candidatus Omnitrophota bacterium]